MKLYEVAGPDLDDKRLAATHSKMSSYGIFRSPALKSKAGAANTFCFWDSFNLHAA